MSELSVFFSENWPDVKDPAGFEATLLSTFPMLDIIQEARKARLWEERAGSHKRNHSRFFTNWCARASASAGAARRASSTQFESESLLTDRAKQRAQREIQRTKDYIEKLNRIIPTPEERKLGLAKCREIMKKVM